MPLASQQSTTNLFFQGCSDRIVQRSSLTQTQRNPPKQSIHGNDPDQDPNPFPRPASSIAVSVQHGRPANLALRSQVRRVHALTPRAARVRPLREFIDHHSLENVRLHTPQQLAPTNN